MNKLKEGFKQCKYTMFHPVNGFDRVKWNNEGSLPVCCIILAAFFLVNVFDEVLTGFIFNTTNPDKISVPSIFLITMGGFAICYVANWAVSSLMFTEGKSRHIFIMLTYTLVPYTVFELIYIIATNFVNNEMNAFLEAIRFIGLLWSFLILLLGEYYVHQLTFLQVVLNLFLTAAGIVVILFLLLLGYSLVQQIYVFLVTIYNEIAFRL
ncbi:MAG: YIP1 family protein [Lachnospiraceae bacterium]